MNVKKQQVPLLLLLSMAAVWSFYYLSQGSWNDFGRNKPEWLLLIDGLLVLPLACWFCIDDKKQAALKALVYACLMVLLGSFIIPEANQNIWQWLSSGRFVVLALFALFELTVMVTVFVAIKAALNGEDDPDQAIQQPIERLLGTGWVSQIMAFEARVWVYVLFDKRVNRSAFRGDAHFFGDQKDGTQSNLLGFILIMAFEIPLMHVLLHFIWSPLAANVISGLTLFSLLWFTAEYRAIAIRPVSISSQGLIIRYGLFNPWVLKWSAIRSIESSQGPVQRQKGVKRFNMFGEPNIKITTKDGQCIYLGLNQPVQFLEQTGEHRLH